MSRLSPVRWACSLVILCSSISAYAADDAVEEIVAACAELPQPCERAAEIVPLLLRRPSPIVRAQAAKALGALKHPDTLAALLSALRFDESIEVRVAAAEAVGAFLPGREAQAALEATVAAAEEPRLVDAASAALRSGTAGEEAVEEGPRDPDEGHIVFAETGFAREPGRFLAKAYSVGGTWSFRYSLSDEWEVGGHASIPVFQIHLGPAARYTHSFTDYVHLGVLAQVHLIAGYSDPLDDVVLTVYGGGPSLSLGTRDLHFTLGMTAYGISISGAWDSETLWALLPQAGFGIRLGDIVKLVAEAYVPVVGHNSEYSDGGEVAVVIYGLRLHGERFFGDITFAMPIWDDMWDVMKYVPMGFPLLNFGFSL